jgi:hypothetical protein
VTLLILLIVLLLKRTVLVFVFVGVIVVLPSTLEHTVTKGGCEVVNWVTVVNKVLVSVLVTCEVETVVEVTILIVEAGMP